MENIYINLAEGTQPHGGVTREFDRSVLTKTFDDIIASIVTHKGDELNQEYDSEDIQRAAALHKAYEKGKNNDNLSVAYLSSLQEAIKSTSLNNKPVDYDDFLHIHDDNMELGSIENSTGYIIIKNNTEGGYN